MQLYNSLRLQAAGRAATAELEEALLSDSDEGSPQGPHGGGSLLSCAVCLDDYKCVPVLGAMLLHGQVGEELRGVSSSALHSTLQEVQRTLCCSWPASAAAGHCTLLSELA